MYLIEFTSDWNECLGRLDNSIKARIWKKVLQIEKGLPSRHLEHGVPFLVEEGGQYRICYHSFEETKIRRFYFVGDHKEYQRWVHEQG